MNGRRAKQRRRLAAGGPGSAPEPPWEMNLPLGMNFECPACGARCRVEVGDDDAVFEGDWRLAARCQDCGVDVVLSEAGVALGDPT